MSKSHKTRRGRLCSRSKDSALESRSQKRAWKKRKQIKNQQDRARGKAQFQKDEATS